MAPLGPAAPAPATAPPAAAPADAVPAAGSTQGALELQGAPPALERSGCGSWGASLVLGQWGEEGFSLWLGSADDALDLDALLAHGITAVLNIARSSCVLEQRALTDFGKQLATMMGTAVRWWATAEFSEEWYRSNMGCKDFRYLALDAEDQEDYPIIELLDEAVAFLQRCRDEGRPTLVHCMMGVNRSACACAAFLMREGLGQGHRRFGMRAAVDLIRQRRPGTLQNLGFLKQLSSYAREGAGAQGAADETAEAQALRDRLLAAAPFEVGPVLERSRAGDRGQACDAADPQEEAPERELPRRTSKFKAARAGHGQAAVAEA